MKIINNTEINNLIIFSKKNLGVYKLVYKDYKKIYWGSIFLVIVAIIFLLLYIVFSKSSSPSLFESIFCIGCLLASVIALYLQYLLNKKTKEKHLKIQDNRYKLLKKYYSNNHYLLNDIKVINEVLNKRIEKIEKQKITILIVLGALAMPIWDAFVQYHLDDFSSQQIIRIILFSIPFSLIIVLILKFCNKGLYHYEENIYIKNNISLIENLLYLNTYIIQEKEVQESNGRRR